MHASGRLQRPAGILYGKEIQYKRHRIYRDGRRFDRKLQDGACFPSKHRAHIILAGDVHTSYGMEGIYYRTPFRSDRGKSLRSACLGHHVSLCLANTDASYNEVP